jgi:hypothetical protein
MRKLALSTAVLALVLAGAPALADGPSGSDETRNQVKCRKGTKTPVGVVYVGTNGVEVCNDGRAVLPVQGRVIVARAQGGYVAADGDRSNPGQAKGWVRVDRKGPRCGDTAGPLDATQPTPRDTVRDCG